MENKIEETAQFAKYVEDNLNKEECHKIFGYDEYDHFYNKLVKSQMIFVHFFLMLDKWNKNKLYFWYIKETKKDIYLDINEIEDFLKYLLSYVGPYKFFDFMDQNKVQEYLKHNYDYLNFWRKCNKDEKNKFIELLNNFKF